MRRHREEGRQDAGIGQRPRQGDEARGVATGIADALGRGNGFALALGHFRKAVGPAFGHAVRRRGVNDADVGVFDQTDGLARRVVGQAQDDGVGRIDGGAASIGILALVTVETDQLNIRSGGETITNLQTRGARFAVNENLLRHD